MPFTLKHTYLTSASCMELTGQCNGLETYTHFCFIGCGYGCRTVLLVELIYWNPIYYWLLNIHVWISLVMAVTGSPLAWKSHWVIFQNIPGQYAKYNDIKSINKYNDIPWKTVILRQVAVYYKHKYLQIYILYIFLLNA